MWALEAYRWKGKTASSYYIKKILSVKKFWSVTGSEEIKLAFHSVL